MILLNNMTPFYNTPSHDAAAIGTLKAMFPEWDEASLGDILVSNGYHVERSVETILSMESSDSVREEDNVSAIQDN